MTGWLDPKPDSPVPIETSQGQASIRCYYESPNRVLVLRLQRENALTSESFLVCVGCVRIPSETHFSYQSLLCQRETEHRLIVSDGGSDVLVRCGAACVLDEASLEKWLGQVNH